MRSNLEAGILLHGLVMMGVIMLIISVEPIVELIFSFVAWNWQ